MLIVAINFTCNNRNDHKIAEIRHEIALEHREKQKQVAIGSVAKYGVLPK